MQFMEISFYLLPVRIETDSTILLTELELSL